LLLILNIILLLILSIIFLLILNIILLLIFNPVDVWFTDWLPGGGQIDPPPSIFLL